MESSDTGIAFGELDGPRYTPEAGPAVGGVRGHLVGEFAHTADSTDVVTGWTEPVAIKNKAHVWIAAAMEGLAPCAQRVAVDPPDQGAGSADSRHRLRPPGS